MCPVIGITAEFNPLHNGHFFMLNEAKSQFKNAACVIVLSSNFTQRGEPALIDKWARAETALLCGADLVLELPFVFSCAAAPDFSAGAVDILAKTNFVSHVAFGMENIDYKNLDKLINLLADEPESFKIDLKKYLDGGMSYTKAVSCAADNIIPDSKNFLLSPNNMLAISYLTRIKKFNYDLTPVFINRIGTSHGEKILPLCHCVTRLNLQGETNFASSGAIRAALNENQENQNLNLYMPEFSLKILNENITNGRICDYKKLWPLIQAFLARTPASELKKYDGINDGLENLFLKHWRNSQNFEDFIDKCVSSRFTRSYIRRCLIRALIGVNKWDAFAVRRLGVPYARVLGFNKTGRELLKKYRNKSKIKFITRLAALKNFNYLNYLIKYEFISSDIYEMLLKNPDLYNDVRHTPVEI